MDIGKPRTIKVTDPDWEMVGELAKKTGITRSKWIYEAMQAKAKEVGVLLGGTQKHGRPDSFRSLLYRDRYQLVARLIDGELIVEDFNNDTAPASVWRTLRADAPAPVEIYLDAASNWQQFSDEDLRTALFLELSAWLSEQDVDNDEHPE